METGVDIDPLSAVYTAPLYTVLFCTVLYCMLYIHTTPVQWYWYTVHSTGRPLHGVYTSGARLRWYGPHLNMLGMYTGLFLRDVCQINMMVSSVGYSDAIY